MKITTKTESAELLAAAKNLLKLLDNAWMTNEQTGERRRASESNSAKAVAAAIAKAEGR